MISKTGSSNAGHGVCCKQGFTGGHCANSATQVCSPGVTAEGAYEDVLTDDKNY